MFCMKCNERMEECNCPGADERIASLRQCEHLDTGMIDRLQAVRHLNKFERMARAQNQKTGETNDGDIEG